MSITAQGIGQPDLDTFLRAVATLNNELKTDRAASSLSIKGLTLKLDADSGVTDTDYNAVLSTGGSGAAWPTNPASAALVPGAFTSIDMSQDDLNTFIQAAETLINELKTDRATMALTWAALVAKLDADAGVTNTDYAAKYGVGGSVKPYPANPAASAIDAALITAQGISQPDLEDVLQAIETLSNELRTDRAVQSACYEGILGYLNGDATVGDTDYAAVLEIGGTGDAWPADPAAAALDLSA